MSSLDGYNESKLSAKAKKRRRRRRRHPFLRLLILAVIIVAAVFVLKSELFSISKIEIEGNKFFTLSQIQEMAGVETGSNIFFDLRTNTARKNLLADPYIKRATVSRVLPTTVKISIEERVEFAAIQSVDGKYILIDEEGMVLRVSDTDPRLSVLEGIELVSAEVGSPLEVKQNYLLNGALELLKMTEEKDLFFKRIFFSSAVVRAYVYDEYYCEGTPENIMENLGPLKELIAQHYQENINKGIIKIGTGGYLSFNPKID